MKHSRPSETKKETACVTGASGCIGQSLLKILLDKNYHVKALFRREDESTAYWREQGCEIILGDLDDLEALDRLTKNATKVIHSAGIMTKDNYNLSRHINFEGTLNLYKVAASNFCQVFVFLSSISVYGGTTSEKNIFTEEIQPQNVDKLNPYSRTKLEVEHTLPELYEQYKIPYIIIRPTNVYGPNSKPWAINILNTFKKIPVSFGNVAVNLVYVDDIAEGVIQAAEIEKTYNHTFNLGNEMSILSEYIQRLCRSQGISVYKIPKSVDHLLRFLFDKIQPLFTGNIQSITFLEPRSYPHIKTSRYFNYNPQTTLENGLRKTIYWLNSLNRRDIFSEKNIFLHRTKHFDPVEIRVIQTEQDIIEAMNDARSLNIDIRSFGAKGSKNMNFHTNGLSLDLSHYNKLLQIEGGDVTVQSGMKLKDLFVILNEHNRALPTIGEWNGQSIAGALSTGTHGGSLKHGALQSSVKSVKIITPSGEKKIFTRGEKEFLAVVVSFGIFGIVSEITLETVPAFNLRMTTSRISFEQYLDQMDDYNEENDFFNAIWIPSTNDMFSYSSKKTEDPITVTKRTPRFSLKNVLLAFGSVKMKRNLFNLLKNTTTQIVGSWEKILCPIAKINPLEVYFREKLHNPLEIEVAFPKEHTKEILLEFRKLFYDHPILYLVGIRFNKADDAYISPCYGRDTFWLQIFIKKDIELFKGCMVLFKRFNARFHWGKSIPVDGEYLKKQYPHWNDVLKLKKHLDPRSICNNFFAKWVGF